MKRSGELAASLRTGKGACGRGRSIDAPLSQIDFLCYTASIFLQLLDLIAYIRLEDISVQYSRWFTLQAVSDSSREITSSAYQH